MPIARLISRVSELAKEDSPEARAVRARLIVDDLKEVAERVAAAKRRLDALERRV